MQKTLAILLTLLLFSISSITTSIAGPRHHSSSYRNNYHPRSYSHYRHRYPIYRSHYYNSNNFWAPLGVGLLTGAIVGSILVQPPRQRTIVYNTPPVYVRAEPVIVQQQYIRQPSGQELILKRVRTTAKLLNVRIGPGLDNDVMGQVEEGTTLDVVGAVADWLYIKTASGQYGWVMSMYTFDTESPVG